MSGLRAEDVEEALEWWEANRDGIYVVRTADDQQRDAPIVAAAREWLAVQEQTRRIWWCVVHDTQANLYYDDDPQCVRNKSVPPDCRIESRALVGIHPQDEGDER